MLMSIGCHFKTGFVFCPNHNLTEKKSTRNELVKEMKYDRKPTLEDGKGLDWRLGFTNWTRAKPKELVTLLGQRISWPSSLAGCRGCLSHLVGLSFFVFIFFLSKVINVLSIYHRDLFDLWLINGNYDDSIVKL